MKIVAYVGNVTGPTTTGWIERNGFFMPSSVIRYHFLKNSREEMQK